MYDVEADNMGITPALQKDIHQRFSGSILSYHGSLIPDYE